MCLSDPQGKLEQKPGDKFLEKYNRKHEKKRGKIDHSHPGWQHPRTAVRNGIDEPVNKPYDRIIRVPTYP